MVLTSPGKLLSHKHSKPSWCIHGSSTGHKDMFQGAACPPFSTRSIPRWGNSKSVLQNSPAFELPLRGKMEEQWVKSPPKPLVCPKRLRWAGLGSWCAQQRSGRGLAGAMSISEPQAATPCCRPLLASKGGESEQKRCFRASRHCRALCDRCAL